MPAEEEQRLNVKKIEVSFIYNFLFGSSSSNLYEVTPAFPLEVQT